MVSLLSSIGAIAGITAVCCLFLSLLFSATSVVVTFLITRKYYSKQRAQLEGPSPEESSMSYANVQPTTTDSLKLQPNPAYDPSSMDYATVSTDSLLQPNPAYDPMYI